MLAFTFGMSGSRFDARKQLVLDEASAVLRAHQRAQFLPEPQRSECSRLLRGYVELRIRVAPQLILNRSSPELPVEGFLWAYLLRLGRECQGP